MARLARHRPVLAQEDARVLGLGDAEAAVLRRHPAAALVKHDGPLVGPVVAQRPENPRGRGARSVGGRPRGHAAVILARLGRTAAAGTKNATRERLEMGQHRLQGLAVVDVGRGDPDA